MIECKGINFFTMLASHHLSALFHTHRFHNSHVLYSTSSFSLFQVSQGPGRDDRVQGWDSLQCHPYRSQRGHGKYLCTLFLIFGVSMYVFGVS